MATQRIGAVEKRIRLLKRRLSGVGNMRPGTLGVQYRNPAERKTPFHQISYTYKGKSRSEYVRPENLPMVRCEIEAYKRFKAILYDLLDLSIQASRIRCGTRLAHPKTIPNKT
jgi:hypothetical protein